MFTYTVVSWLDFSLINNFNAKEMLKMKKNILNCVLSIFAFFSYCSPSEAALSMFSRANCYLVPLADIGNESISWDKTLTNHTMVTFSGHWVRGELRHRIQDGWRTTFRTAATHREISDQTLWFVYGTHIRQVNGNLFTTNTSATDCNLTQF